MTARGDIQHGHVEGPVTGSLTENVRIATLVQLGIVTSSPPAVRSAGRWHARLASLLAEHARRRDIAVSPSIRTTGIPLAAPGAAGIVLHHVLQRPNAGQEAEPVPACAHIGERLVQRVLHRRLQSLVAALDCLSSTVAQLSLWLHACGGSRLLASFAGEPRPPLRTLNDGRDNVPISHQPGLQTQR